MASDNNEVFDVSFDVNDNFDSNDGFDVDNSNNPSQSINENIVTTDSTNSHPSSNFVQEIALPIENRLVIEDKSVNGNLVVDQSSNQAFNASDTQADNEANLANNPADNLVDVDNDLDKIENSNSENSSSAVIANFPIIDSINNGTEQNNQLNINDVVEETTLDLSDDMMAGDSFPTCQPSNVTPIPLANNLPANNLPVSNLSTNNLLTNNLPVSNNLPASSLPTNSNPSNNTLASSNFDVNSPSSSNKVVDNKIDNLPKNVDKDIDIAETVEIPDSIFDSAIDNIPSDDTLNTYPGVAANSTTSKSYHNSLASNNSTSKDSATDNNSNDQGINNEIENNSESSDGENNESSDDESDVVENVLPLTTPQNATTKLMSKSSSDGNLSKRVIGVALLVVIGGLLVWGTQENTNKGSANNKLATIKPIQVEKSNLKNTLNSPNMGERPDQGRMLPPPEVVEPPPPVIIAPPPEPPPLGAGEPVVINNVEPSPRQYSFQMRRGNMVMQKWEQEQKNELASLQARNNKSSANNEQANNVKIPRGTVIPMMMIQPFRNDLAGVVKCQIMVDVKTAKGQVLIPAGSIASVPFSQFRNDKRVFNRVDTPTIISVNTNSNNANAASSTNTDGVVNEANEIQLFGTAMDKKGFVGLEGKLRKTGDASVFKRVGRTMARALTFGAASSVGGATGVVVSEGGNSAIDSTYFYTDRTGTFVELPLGTMFFFNVN
ncbi:MAG: hypothetical protein WAQ98_09575 [Blastocatellia bacterium]